MNWKAIENKAVSSLKQLLKNEPEILKEFNWTRSSKDLGFKSCYKITYHESIMFPIPSFSVKIGCFDNSKYDTEHVSEFLFYYEYVVDEKLKFVDEFVD